jgi:hypothetical protein
MDTNISAPRQRVILTILAWGDQHLDRLLRLTLPAILAPGNYPVLAQTYDCEFAFATQSSAIARLSESDAVRRLSALGRVRYVEIDDLLIGPGSYGLTLAFAFFRVVESFGDAAMETYFLFLNSDFILADESYRNLIPLINSGVNVICAPSYCAVEEHVRPILEGRVSQQEGILAVTKRDMAALILEHPHNTLRGQLIDGAFHYDHVYLYQAYVQPDSHTLVGYQMPIAVVALKPTRRVESFGTFWDWGVVSELCPSGKEYVMADSDEFLMLELRQESVGNDLLRLGAVTPELIAERLGSQLTEDQIHFGGFPLTLHSKDLTSCAVEACEALAGFRRRVLELLPAQSAQHLNHPNWLYHHSLYQKSKTIIGDFWQVPSIDSQLRQQTRLGQLYRWALGQAPSLSRIHPYRGALRSLLSHLSPHLFPETNVVIVSDHESAIQQHISAHCRKLVRISVAASLEKWDVSGERFDFCFCELGFHQLRELRGIYDSNHRALKAEGKFIVFSVNEAGEKIQFDDPNFINGTLSMNAPVRAYYEGSLAAWWAMQIYNKGRQLSLRSHLIGMIVLAVSAVAWIPLALMANRSKRKAECLPNKCASRCTDLIIEIDVPKP